MSDTNDILPQVIGTGTPLCLDTVITRNRHLARLYLATDDEVSRLSRIILPVADDGLRGAVSEWRLISYESTLPGMERQLHIHLLGDNPWRAVGTKITSAVVGIDFRGGLVATHSGSLYKLIGERGEGEPTLHQLLQVCGAMWSWGRGDVLGVTHVSY